MPLKEPYPRTPESLVKEVDATIKIKDIKDIYRLKEVVAMQWWEAILILTLFIAGSGFLITILHLKYLFPPEKRIILTFLLVWTIILILTLIAAIEFLLYKFKALRRLYELQSNLILSLKKEIAEVKNPSVTSNISDDKKDEPAL